MPKCFVCNSRKGKRECLLAETPICSLCCGKTRCKEKCEECSYFKENSLPKLYQLAEELHTMAPWEWMYESEMLAVEDPQTGELYFVSIMGRLGEHQALAVYPNVKAAYDIYDLSSSEYEIDTDPTSVLQIPQCHLSFERKKYLDFQDYKDLLELVPAYKNKSILPCVKKYQPGRVPWKANDEDLRIMELVLEQSLEILPRFKESGAEELYEKIDQNTFLCRYQNSKKEWLEEFREISYPDPVNNHSFANPLLLKQIKLLKPMNCGLIIDLSMLPIPIDEDDKDIPFFPYVLLIINEESGNIISCETLSPLPDLDHLMTELPQRILESIIKSNEKPRQIFCCSQHLYEITQRIFTLTEINSIPIEKPEFIFDFHEQIMDSFDQVLQD